MMVGGFAADNGPRSGPPGEARRWRPLLGQQTLFGLQKTGCSGPPGRSTWVREADQAPVGQRPFIKGAVAEGEGLRPIIE